MKQSTRLSSAVFHLTPTRTRCDLIIVANDKKEKIASGLLSPFLAHLKTAQDQVAKGGYSILLEPGSDTDATWFTKAILERFVRFVSTPEILERVYTIETEVLQIEEAIAIQKSNDIGQSNVEDHQKKPTGGREGNKLPNANVENAVVIYQPGTPQSEANDPCLQQGNSKDQVLKVLESRKTMLQKEQGMAFARATAAGFEVDHMAPLVSFAQCFGALRLMEACSRFMDIWESKLETGEWLGIEASEALSMKSGFSTMNASGVILSAPQNKHDKPYQERASKGNGRSESTYNADNPALNGQQEYFQGQFPHTVFPPWPMHAPPGTQPVFQPYTVQGLPYYQPYVGSGPFSQPPPQAMEYSPSSFGHQTGQRMQSVDGRDCNTRSETWEIDRTRSLDDLNLEISQNCLPQKKSGGYNKKQTGAVVIQNINYIDAKEKKSICDSNSAADSNIDTEDENVETDGHDAINQHRKRYSKSKRRHPKPEDDLNFSKDEVSNFGKDTDFGHWHVFQNCLLGSHQDALAVNEGMFATEKNVKMKNGDSEIIDPLALDAWDTGPVQETRMNYMQHMISGNSSSRPRGSGDDALFSRADDDFRGTNYLRDVQFIETNGRNIISRTRNEDFMIGSHQNQELFINSSEPLAVNSFKGATNKMDNGAPHRMADETFIVPVRSMSIDQVGQEDRTAIVIDSEIPSSSLSDQRFNSCENSNRLYYEPDDVNMMPERGTENVGYDPALEYEMQVCAVRTRERGEKAVTDVKGGLRKSQTDRSKITSDSLYNQRTADRLMNGKPSKMSPLENARLRADRLRTYKADLQKMKKEKEDVEAKRLEALKLERQKRIAARGSLTSGKPPVLSPQPKQFPAKLSPVTNRGSKFSDSEPGSSSPLQRSKIKIPLGAGEPFRASKASKLKEVNNKSGNRLIKSSSSLPETKNESNGITPDSKASMARIRRLSEPKALTNRPVTSTKVRSAEAVLKRKLFEVPEKNKISAIVNLDRSKAANLPELKIKASKSQVNADENINGIKQSKYCENAELNASNCSTEQQTHGDDNPIVEKTVVMLEYEKSSVPVPQSSELKSELWNQRYDDYRDKVENNNLRSEFAPVFSPPSPVDRAERNHIMSQLQEQLDSNEVRTPYSEKDPPEFANIITAEKPYWDPSAHFSSAGNPSSCLSECLKAPLVSSESASRVGEAEKAHVPHIETLKMDIDQVSSEKASMKRPSKGLMRLLKFGKKNHTSSSVNQSFDSDCTNGAEQSDNARNAASASEVHTLKNLISQDEGSSAGNAPKKTFRHFSLFSPFWIKTSEKKQTS